MCLKQGEGEASPPAQRSVGARGELAIEAHRETLVKNYGHVARADLHFTLGPGRNGGELHAESVLEFLNRTVIHGYFSQPGAFLPQIGRQFVAQMHECAEITGGDRRAVNSSRQVQRVGKRLIGGGDPDRAPLRNSELHQGEPCKREDEDRDHILLIVSFLGISHLAYGTRVLPR